MSSPPVGDTVEDLRSNLIFLSDSIDAHSSQLTRQKREQPAPPTEAGKSRGPPPSSRPPHLRSVPTSQISSQGLANADLLSSYGSKQVQYTIPDPDYIDTAALSSEKLSQKERVRRYEKGTELRMSLDLPYSKKEFIDYFGEVEGRHEWNSARPYEEDEEDEDEENEENEENEEKEEKEDDGEEDDGGPPLESPMEGFICPHCKHHLISPEALHSHFQTSHNNNKADYAPLQRTLTRSTPNPNLRAHGDLIVTPILSPTQQEQATLLLAFTTFAAGHCRLFCGPILYQIYKFYGEPEYTEYRLFRTAVDFTAQNFFSRDKIVAKQHVYQVSRAK